MKTEKTAWIDEENKIVSFHAIDNFISQLWGMGCCHGEPEQDG